MMKIMTEEEYILRLAFVREANRWLGTKKGDANHERLIKIYNTISPHPRGYALRNTDAWCAAFVSVVAHIMSLDEIFPFECSCSAMVSGLVKTGQWVEDDKYVPSIGDLYFYDWEDTTGTKSDNTGSPNHVGIVSNVHENSFTLIEGNRGGECKLVEATVNQKYTRGFGVLNWEKLIDKIDPCEWCIENGIFLGNGEGDYMWYKVASRSEVATVLYRLYNLIMKNLNK